MSVGVASSTERRLNWNTLSGLAASLLGRSTLKKEVVTPSASVKDNTDVEKSVVGTAAMVSVGRLLAGRTEATPITVTRPMEPYCRHTAIEAWMTHTNTAVRQEHTLMQEKMNSPRHPPLQRSWWFLIGAHPGAR